MFLAPRDPSAPMGSSVLPMLHPKELQLAEVRNAEVRKNTHTVERQCEGGMEALKGILGREQGADQALDRLGNYLV